MSTLASKEVDLYTSGNAPVNSDTVAEIARRLDSNSSETREASRGDKKVWYVDNDRYTLNIAGEQDPTKARGADRLSMGAEVRFIPAGVEIDRGIRSRMTMEDGVLQLRGITRIYFMENIPDRINFERVSHGEILVLSVGAKDRLAGMVGPYTILPQRKMSNG